ncbi:MAG: site-specific integrase [Acidobacteriota bacterium]|nr:site-specific integrase [Acidobacteriota bacterium]
MPVPEPPVFSEPATAVLRNDELATIECGAAEFLADIENRQMGESTRRKYRTMLKQLRAFAEEFGFRYLNQFSVDELTKFRATRKDGLRSVAKKLERVRAVFRFAQQV